VEEGWIHSLTDWDIHLLLPWTPAFLVLGPLDSDGNLHDSLLTLPFSGPQSWTWTSTSWFSSFQLEAHGTAWAPESHEAIPNLCSRNNTDVASLILCSTLNPLQLFLNL
jgi:hypothetical protein